MTTECQTKKCRICGIEKPLEDYYRVYSRRATHAATCKKCKNKADWAKQKALPVVKNHVGKEKDPDLLKLREARIKELSQYYGNVPRSYHTVLARVVDERIRTK